jgi:hypothetical protein
MNRNNDKNHIIISINAGKAFDKIQHPFMIKSLKKVGLEETYIQTIMATHCKSLANIILSAEKLKSFPLQSGTRIFTLFTLIQYNTGIPS